MQSNEIYIVRFQNYEDEISIYVQGELSEERLENIVTYFENKVLSELYDIIVYYSDESDYSFYIDSMIDKLSFFERCRNEFVCNMRAHERHFSLSVRSIVINEVV